MEWIKKYRGMVCLTANNLWWTSETEYIFDKIKNGNKGAMKEYLNKLNKQLDDLVYQIRKGLLKF